MAEENQFARKVIITAIIVILIFAVVALLIYGFKYFLMLFGGILFGVLLRAATNLLHRFIKIKKGILLGIVILTFIGLLVGLFFLLSPTISGQIEEIKNRVPQALSELENSTRKYSWGDDLVDNIKDGSDDLINDVNFYGAAGFLTSTIAIIADFLIILVFGIFFAADPGLYKKGIVSLFAPKYRPRMEEVIMKIYKVLAHWLLGKFVAMLFVGTLVGIGLAIIGVPLTLGLAVIAFFLDFVNMIGPIASAVPGVLLAFLEGPNIAIYTALMYLVVQQVESYVIIPLVYQNAVNISPVVTLASMVFFGFLAGILGVILAVPLVVALKVIINELYVKDYLEKGGIATSI